jgi:two-component system NtrC family sensor kinase
MVSALVLLIGILLGLLLARKISIPLMALRDAANRVGEGDLTQKVKQISNDEIGELGKAFNHMVDDLLKTRKELRENNQEL